MVFGGPLGLTEEFLDVWKSAGLIHEALVQLEPLAPAAVAFHALTPLGAREFSNATGTFVKSVSHARLRRSGRKLAHDVLVGECVLAVLTLARDERIDLIGVEADDKKLGTSTALPGLPPRRVALQADALVITKTERGASSILIELDRGTIAKVKMQEKFAGYLAWHRTDGPARDFNTRALRVLTVVPNQKRLAALHAAALAANDGRRSGLLLFALQRDVAAVDAERLLGPVARPLGDDERVPLFVKPPTAPMVLAA
jgi:hypothetical protein